MSDVTIRPQPGPQEAFLASPADIVVYGGEAGGGKSFGLLLEPLRHAENPKFGGVIFRRTSPQLTGPGSLWEKAQGIYPLVGATMTHDPLTVRFPSGASLLMLHLQHAGDVHDHQGKEYAYIGFDELTHFERFQFWYMVSRMRSMSGVRSYMRCTTNPDPDSFVAELISWWIGDPDCGECAGGTCTDVDHGYPIAERSGVLRWFLRRGDDLIWGDSREALLPMCEEGEEPLSITFIHARLADNPALMKADPGYRARLMALPEVERRRLLGGNWRIRPSHGKYVEEGYFTKRWSGCLPGCKEPHTHQDLLPPLNIYSASDYAVDELPERAKAQGPDFTEHGIFGISPDGDLYVLDWWYGQTKSDVWIESLLDKAVRWKQLVAFGESGVIQKAVAPFLTKRMRERKVYVRTEWLSTGTGARGEGSSKQGYEDRSKLAKARRGRSFQAMASAGRIIFPARAEWVARVIAQLVGFPVGKDDAFDVMSHMCQAIAEAHPAILPVKPKPDSGRKMYTRTNVRRIGSGGGSWKRRL